MRLANRLVLPLLIAAAFMFARAPFMIVAAPTEATMGIVQRIFYFHVPSASMTFLAAFVCGLASAIYLFRRSPAADRVAVSAAELAVVFGIIVLVTDKVNKLTRFHAAQSLLLTAVMLVIGIPGYVIAGVLALSGSSIMALLGTVIWLVVALVGLAVFVFWIISAIKAFGGEIYKVPVIGDYADKISN